MSSVEIPKDWIRENAEDVSTVLDYLSRNPTDFQTLLVFAKLTDDAHPMAHALATGDASFERHLEPHAAEVKRWLETGELQFCAACLTPVIVFLDEVRIDWPATEVWHQCVRAPVASQDARGGEMYSVPVYPGNFRLWSHVMDIDL